MNEGHAAEKECRPKNLQLNATDRVEGVEGVRLSRPAKHVRVWAHLDAASWLP